jgi:hypothetical protein
MCVQYRNSWLLFNQILATSMYRCPHSQGPKTNQHQRKCGGCQASSSTTPSAPPPVTAPANTAASEFTESDSIAHTNPPVLATEDNTHDRVAATVAVDPTPLGPHTDKNQCVCEEVRARSTTTPSAPPPVTPSANTAASEPMVSDSIAHVNPPVLATEDSARDRAAETVDVDPAPLNTTPCCDPAVMSGPTPSDISPRLFDSPFRGQKDEALQKLAECEKICGEQRETVRQLRDEKRNLEQQLAEIRADHQKAQDRVAEVEKNRAHAHQCNLMLLQEREDINCQNQQLTLSMEKLKMEHQRQLQLENTRLMDQASKASQQVQDVRQELQKAVWHKAQVESKMKDLETRFNQQQVLHQREVQVRAFSFS